MNAFQEKFCLKNYLSTHSRMSFTYRRKMSGTPEETVTETEVPSDRTCWVLRVGRRGRRERAIIKKEINKQEAGVKV